MTCKRLDDYPNYVIFDDGRVYSLTKKRFLKILDNGNGYKKVNLYNNGKHVQKYIHRLIAQVFIKNSNNYKYIDHLDRNKENNHYLNLRWCTAKQNTNNVANKKRYIASRKNPQHYTIDFKNQIKNEYISGVKVMDLARKYSIPRQSVSRFIKDAH